ncbi:MAG: YkgJ family cysteine cluster protein [Armatimonadetes bacterium]|nr:YkgJ family cysteine cluster protein [Armatimonadota bacterium]
MINRVESTFKDLRGFYGRLDAHLQRTRPPRQEGSANACGTCLECCKYNFYLSRHEYDLIEAHLLETRGESPIRWVNCSTNIQDARRHRPFDPEYRCPLYDMEKGGCSVYEVRPLACRTLGPMLPCHSKLPDWCVYDQPKVYERAEEIPLWDQFLRIIHAHGGASRGYFEIRGC